MKGHITELTLQWAMGAQSCWGPSVDQAGAPWLSLPRAPEVGYWWRAHHCTPQHAEVRWDKGT